MDRTADWKLSYAEQALMGIQNLCIDLMGDELPQRSIWKVELIQNAAKLALENIK